MPKTGKNADAEVVTWEEAWSEKCPCFIPDDTENGTLIVMESIRMCRTCGQPTTVSRVTYVWAGTENEELLELGFGASVKHLFTECVNPECPVQAMVS